MLRRMKRALLFGFPVLVLLLYLLRLPLPVPAFLLPRRVVLAPGGDPRFAFEALQRHRRLLLPGQGALLELRRAEYPTPASLAERLAAEPGPADLAAVLGRTVPLLPRSSRLLLLADRPPSAEEVRGIRALQKAGSPSIALRTAGAPYDPLFMALACTFVGQESRFTFDLQFSGRVARYRALSVRRDGGPPESLKPAELAQGRDYRASFEVPPSGELSLELALTGAESEIRRTIRLRTPLPQEPQVLWVTDKPPARGLLDQLCRLKRVSSAQAAGEDLAAYPLLAFDGVPLRALGPRLSEAVAAVHRRGSASLLFVSDGPEFGRRGDNPELERILPAELAPRSLRYLPDLGILILLDVSASMMGPKLSLAKVSTLELLKNLKDTDRVSVLAFWDQYRYLHDFQLRGGLRAEVELAPLIAEGGTDLHPALADGLTRLARLDMKERHALIISDGKTREADFESLLRGARLSGITVSAVAVGEEVNAALLGRVAQATGGRYYRVHNLQEIPSIIFEDRREVARSSFARDLFSITSAGGSELGQVTGMSLFTAKPGRPVLLRNQFGDPLLLLERRRQQFLGMFLSDLYGTYTAGLFSNPRAVDLFRGLLEPVRPPPTVRWAEAFRALTLTVSGEELVEPRVELYGANRVAAEKRLQRGAFRTCHAELALSEPGPYTAVVFSRGVPRLRLPVYYNGVMEGRQSDAARELLRYRPAAFVLLPAGNFLLVCFFLASVAVTWLARRSGM